MTHTHTHTHHTTLSSVCGGVHSVAVCSSAPQHSDAGAVPTRTPMPPPSASSSDQKVRRECCVSFGFTMCSSVTLTTTDTRTNSCRRGEGHVKLCLGTMWAGSAPAEGTTYLGNWYWSLSNPGRPFAASLLLRHQYTRVHTYQQPIVISNYVVLYISSNTVRSNMPGETAHPLETDECGTPTSAATAHEDGADFGWPRARWSRLWLATSNAPQLPETQVICSVMSESPRC